MPGRALPAHLADSAGQPWQGRHFESHGAPSDDDGTAPPALLAALQAFRAGEGAPDAVVDAVREVRLLVPLVAHAGDEGVTEAGLRVDKTQELSLVTVAGPGGRTVLPAFTSVAALSAWNPTARPIPVAAPRAALAAVAEGTELIVVDPGSDTEFVLRRPAVWAIARSTPWRPAVDDPEVVAAFEASIADEPSVAALRLVPGDPGYRMLGHDVVVALALLPGLDQAALGALTSRLQQRWAEHPLIAERVDSLGVRLTAAG
ncbi:SseB family protein [Herbiconiux sp. CPCC 205716]|uniref:SseB family protein n=1 Tax=Herbiconiux gentiana TaxID=2970912 RepID=A0ABT2GDR9_9MICO|nr:SseB family protein [Herbiconiux gentiana]MCS5714333.1 SseB family protein [Herbiconiux gentiana]